MDQKGHTYIYTHVDGDEIVYVGKGTGGRAFATTGRKGGHEVFMLSRISAGDTSFVVFILTGLQEQMASLVEAEIIRHFQPRYNRFFTEEWRTKNVERGLRGAEATKKPVFIPDGKFDSVSDAARYMGVTPTAILYHIKRNKEGYSYV